MPDPLATTDDIAARLGRDLTDAELTRSQVLLADASAQIRRYCKQDFGLHTGQDTVFRGPGGVIKFPDRTTTAVHSVTAIGGSPGLPDFRVPLWNFDGIDTVRLWSQLPVINVPEVWWDNGAYPGTYRVNRDWGYTLSPDEVVAVCANAVIGVLQAPTQAAGIISEQIGPYSYRLEKSGGGIAVALTQADLASLKDFRLGTLGTIKTGTGGQW
jgi:hypothetical protein